MNNYDSNIICDYVTLWLRDSENNPNSDLSDGLAVWDIPPQAYYYKDRGTVCMMSIVNATIHKGVGDNIILMTQQGFNSSTAQIYGDNNQFENDIQDLGTVGNFIKNQNANPPYFETKYGSPEVIKVLTPARPSQLKLYFVDENKELVNFKGGTDRYEEGHFTIKFEYINPEILQQNIYSSEYKPAF